VPGESGPQGITTGPEGNLWFGQFGALGELNPTTHVASDFATSTGTSSPIGLASGPEGNVWFTVYGTNRVGEINPMTDAIGQFTTATPQSWPRGITAGPDGKMWIAESLASRIGAAGTGAPPASIGTPLIAGGGHAGTAQVCAGAQWSSFASQQPLAGLFSFDGFQWLLNGTPIAGQTTDSYTPTSAEDGNTLTCQETVSYPLTHVTAVATSAPVTVIP